jgi:Protein of unknown function (DUF2637)
MTGADRIIKWSIAVVVLGVALVAAVVSYEHASALVQAHGEEGWKARLIPLTVDGLIYASSVMLDSARRKMPVPALARWLLGMGIAAAECGHLNWPRSECYGQRSDLSADRRPSHPVRIGPFLGDQAAVPPQDSAGGD